VLRRAIRRREAGESGRRRKIGDSGRWVEVLWGSMEQEEVGL
jgi:hypothetical protein